MISLLFHEYKKLIFPFYILALIFFFSPGQAYAIRGIFLYRLADFQGIAPSMWARVAVDEERTESYTLDNHTRRIHIYNEQGMDIFTFGENVDLFAATDIDIGKDGDIYVLFPLNTVQPVLRLDYKGDPLNTIKLQNLPADFKNFQPNFLQYMDDKLYLADSEKMDVVVIDLDGQFQLGYHLSDYILEVRDKFKNRAGDKDIQLSFEDITFFGFWADHEGNIFFTVPVLFSVFKLSPDGDIQLFGKAGGGKGKFGVVSGITTDNRGHIYVTDRLKSVVLMFNSRFEYLTEFGFRGGHAGNLIVPNDLVVDNKKGLLYVAQSANRGVSVFRIW